MRNCLTYGNNIAGAYFVGKYDNPSGLDPIFAYTVNSWTHTIVGFYTRPLGSSNWGTNLITSNPTITTPVGTTPNIAAFLNSNISPINSDIVFYDNGVGGISSVDYNINYEWYVEVLDSPNNALPNTLNFVFGAIQQGGSGGSVFGDNFSGDTTFLEGDTRSGDCTLL